MQWYPMAGRYLLLSSKEFCLHMVAPSWVLLLLMWLLYVSFGECYKQSRALFCFKSIQTCCLGMISWWNFPKSNFSIFLNMLVCRINSTMNVFLKYAILYNDFVCRGWRHLHPIFPASWLHHRQMGTASLLKSLGMRGLMKVTGFRYLTETDATLGWLWVQIWWSYGYGGYGLDAFLYEYVFSCTNANEAWFSSFTYSPAFIRC